MSTEGSSWTVHSHLVPYSLLSICHAWAPTRLPLGQSRDGACNPSSLSVSLVCRHVFLVSTCLEWSCLDINLSLGRGKKMQIHVKQSRYICRRRTDFFLLWLQSIRSAKAAQTWAEGGGLFTAGLFHTDPNRGLRTADPGHTLGSTL